MVSDKMLQIVYECLESKDKEDNSFAKKILDEHPEYRELIKTRITNVELTCKGDICIDKNGEVVIDLSKTECNPDQAQRFLKSIVGKPEVSWKMPSLKQK